MADGVEGLAAILQLMPSLKILLREELPDYKYRLHEMGPDSTFVAPHAGNYDAIFIRYMGKDVSMRQVTVPYRFLNRGDSIHIEPHELEEVIYQLIEAGALVRDT